MILCLSAIRLHFAQLQSLNRQCLLWPLSQEIIPWFRHLAHFGRRAEEPPELEEEPSVETNVGDSGDEWLWLIGESELTTLLMGSSDGEDVSLESGLLAG